MAARRMLVTGDREPADDLALVFCDKDGRVRVAPDRAEVAALVGRAAPTVRRHEPAFGLTADGVPELGEPVRVAPVPRGG